MKSLDCWEKIGEEYWLNRTSRQKWVHNFILFPSIKKIVNTTQKILDFGCGDGAFIGFLNDGGFDQVFGYDKSQAMTQIAQKTFGKNQILRSIDGIKFDCIVMNMVIQDVEDITQLLYNLQQNLSDNGRIIISVPHPIFSLIESDHITTQRIVHNPASEIGINRYIYEDYEEVIWNNQKTRTLLFNRTVSSYVDSFRKAQFLIDKIFEPLPIENSDVEMNSIYSKHPKFMIFVLKHDET